jgi:hypothetical protein
MYLWGAPTTKLYKSGQKFYSTMLVLSVAPSLKMPEC